MGDIQTIKNEIYKISAISDRGQRFNKLIAPIYKDKEERIKELIAEIEKHSEEITEEILSGNWELIFSTVELFRSSPFFLAIEKALNNRDKSNLFFKLHLLQVGSFGISTIGRVFQKIDFDKRVFVSTFDTTIFGLTVIPFLGWFKILPTFGGRVTTIADQILLNNKILSMKVQKTRVTKIDGLNQIPYINKWVMDKWYPVNQIWIKLPWNKSEPECEISTIYRRESKNYKKYVWGYFYLYKTR